MLTRECIIAYFYNLSARNEKDVVREEHERNKIQFKEHLLLLKPALCFSPVIFSKVPVQSNLPNLSTETD